MITVALTGAFVNPDPVYLQSTGFVLDPAGNVVVSVCPFACMTSKWVRIVADQRDYTVERWTSRSGMRRSAPTARRRWR